ncbi:hypothetical protein OKW45_002531 [Paraburkholderia sp. WSM4175]|uniref:hypothetical protein n=1 Tax=Paraburkholderia sp. WSM4175 TaxID=2991072 RepID=UPI003D1F6BE6
MADGQHHQKHVRTFSNNRIARFRAGLFTQPKVLVIVAIVCSLLWGSSYPGIKIGYALLGITQNDIPSKLISAGYRFVLAGLSLLILATLSKKPVFDLNRRHSGQLMRLGFTQTAIQYARRRLYRYCRIRAFRCIDLRKAHFAEHGRHGHDGLSTRVWRRRRNGALAIRRLARLWGQGRGCRQGQG